MITPSSIEQIKSRIDIIDVIGEYIKLKKRGVNYLGNCPFHNEKTPSFTVSPSKEIYKCFGCGKSGNTITFLMEHDKLSYVEALRWLAKRYNIEIEETEQSPEQKLQVQTGDSLYAINSFAQQFFSHQLWETESGKDIAATYLKQRGFRESILQKFQVGYNPSNGTVLAEALKSNQFNEDYFAKTGLVVNRNDTWFDNYRGRIIFPIHGITGKIIGFGARVIGKADNAPKYINTPENEIYNKSKILYGLYFARQAIDKANECLLVEGYTDVVSLHQAGIENVVASGGTSLTIEQLRLIKKYTPNLTIIYDGDAAGVKAALRGLDLALEEGLNVRLVLIPDNEDPDSYVYKLGTTAFNSFIQENKKDFILFKVEVLLKDAGNDITRKNEVVNQVAESLSKLTDAKDFAKLQAYTKQCSSLLQIDEGGLINLINTFKREKVAKEAKKQNETKQPQEQDFEPVTDQPTLENIYAEDELHERNVLRVLLEFGLKPFTETETVAQHIFYELENFHFEVNALDELYHVYQQAYTQGKQPNTAYFLQDNRYANLSNLVASIVLFPYQLSQNWDKVLEGMHILDKDTMYVDVVMSLNYFKLKKIKKMFIQNQAEIGQAKTYEEQITLLEVHKNLKEIEREITKQLGTVIL